MVCGVVCWVIGDTILYVYGEMGKCFVLLVGGFSFCFVLGFSWCVLVIELWVYMDIHYCIMDVKLYFCYWRFERGNRKEVANFVVLFYYLLILLFI